MASKKPKKLSTILSTYFTVTVVILTGAVLYFTYYTSLEALKSEITKSFDQQYRTSENIIEREADRIENALQKILLNTKLLSKLADSETNLARKAFINHADRSQWYRLDVLIVSTTNEPVWLDASSPFPDVKPILNNLSENKRMLLLKAKILRFKNGTTDLTGIFKAHKIILEDGRVLGVLIAGTILNDNLVLLNTIKEQTKSSGVVLNWATKIISSSAGDKSAMFEQLVNSLDNHNLQSEGDFFKTSKNGLLISNPYKINLYGSTTPAQIIFSMDSDVLEKVKKSYRKTLAVLSTMFIIFLLFSLFFIKKLIYPSMNRMLEYTERIITEDSDQISIEPGSIIELNTIGIAMEKMVTSVNEAKLLAQEMELARRIQTGLLPKSVSDLHPDFEMAAVMLTADQVGGDYYDITFDGNEKLWISIGDVSGHGVKPGLIMMMAQTVHATVTSSMNCEAKDVVIAINQILYRNVRERLNEKNFMTFNALKYIGDGKFEHAGAHLRIIVYRYRLDKCELIWTKGVYLNLKKNISKAIENSYFTLAEGDIMILYSDGLTEAVNQNGEMLDTDGLIGIIEKHVHQKPSVMKDSIITEVVEWCKNKREDDMTIVIVKKRGEMDDRNEN